MPKYICPRCKYSTNIKTHIKNHFKRKHPCRAIVEDISIEKCISALNDNKLDLLLNNHKKRQKSVKKASKKPNTKSYNLKFTCKFCDERCNSRQSLHYHIKNSCLYNNSKTDELEKQNFLNQFNKIMKVQLDAKDMIINELKSQIEVLLKNQGNNNTHNTQYNILLKSFGSENTSYITSNYVHSLINDGPVMSIPKLLKYIHFNPEHLENRNVKIPNKKQNYAQIYNGKDWEYRDKRETIDNMTHMAYGIINEHYVKGENKYMDQFLANYGTQDISISKRILRDTELMIINNQTSFNENLLVENK